MRGPTNGISAPQAPNRIRSKPLIAPRERGMPSRRGRSYSAFLMTTPRLIGFALITPGGPEVTCATVEGGLGSAQAEQQQRDGNHRKRALNHRRARLVPRREQQHRRGGGHRADAGEEQRDPDGAVPE